MTFVIVIFLFSLIVRRGLNWMVMKIKLGAGQQQKKRSENLTQLWLLIFFFRKPLRYLNYTKCNKKITYY